MNGLYQIGLDGLLCAKCGAEGRGHETELTSARQVMYTGSVNKPEPRDWDWFSAFVLFLMLQVVTARLVTTNWAPYLYFTETLAGLGTMLGLAMGASRFSGRTVFMIGAAYTIFVVPWQLSSVALEDLFLDRLGQVGAVLLVSSGQFLRGQPVKDPLFFVALVCLAFWLIGIFSGYWFARYGRIIGALVLAGAGIIAVQVYANYQAHGSWWLAVFLLLSLLLVGRAYFLQSKKDWIRRRVFVNDEAWPSILGSLFVTVGLAIVVAWAVPVSAAGLNTASDWWNSFTRPLRDRLSNAVTSLNGPYGAPGSNFYGATLGIGRDAAKGDSTVFTVDVLEGGASTPRFYWQGRVYDQYSGGQWSTLPATSVPFKPADGTLQIPDATGRSAATLQFTNQFSSQTLLYAPAQAVWFDRAAVAVAAQPQAGEYDVFSWEADTAVTAGGTYQAKAELADPNVQQLQAADTAYPAWITDRYLEVPQNLQGELQNLALQITGGQSSPYDKAAAITAYLRANIQYSDAVPPPPEGQDPVAWVLFDYKKGFCNYYASAEVLLLRSIGIPARLGVGFAQGELQNGLYVVRRRDAHAWPEVYFTGYGWIEFEPTASQAPLVRPDLTPAITGGALPNQHLARPLEGEEGAGPQDSGSGSARPLPLLATAAGRAISVLTLLLGAAGIIYFLIHLQVWVRVPELVSRSLQHNGLSTPTWVDRWIRWNRLEPVERSFASVNWSLRWLGKPQPTDATPAERARVLSRLLPSAAADISALQTEFEAGLFTPQPADLGRARRASRAILGHLIVARLQRLLGAPDVPDVY